MGTAIRIIQVVTLVIIVTYIALSFQSALRMLFVHWRYMHVEFVPPQRLKGSWAPRRQRLLRRLFWAAVLAAIVLLATSVAGVIWLQS